jgi:hypothetical protein
MVLDDCSRLADSLYHNLMDFCRPFFQTRFTLRDIGKKFQFGQKLAFLLKKEIFYYGI